MVVDGRTEEGIGSAGLGSFFGEAVEGTDAFE